ncbi:sugar ABC transporter ATP-binding protein [Salipaludibacillus sp. CF4.18]|uniref:sugar ABC transporter ATP-binding protein n=1 Tax=Salipaludibacillus sp. CF4.18 TaxID=3373081 RepID=UPI003EE719A2
MSSKLDYLFEVRSVSKSYGSTQALSDVTFTLMPGETVAVIGQNGAGKSTFAKIIAGSIQPDEGEIYVKSCRVTLFPPKNALRYGIAFIPQELAYVPKLTVAENVMLGRIPNRKGFISYKEMIKRTKHEAKRFGLNIDPLRKMSSLKLADKQIVEILKALSRRASVILLDEPTASLSDNESKNLFRIIGKLAREEKVGIVYISHRMDEVFNFSDRIDVFRNGRLVASEQTATSDHEKLIAHMLGKQREQITLEKFEYPSANPALSVLNWSSRGLPSLSNVTFNVKEKEVVSIFGVRGCGAEIVAEGLVGLQKEIEGEIILEGKKRRIFRNPLEAKKANVAYVPADRKKQGLVLKLSIRKNATLPILRLLSNLGLMNSLEERKTAEKYTSRFNTKCQSIEQNVSELSGGNQQKVLLAGRLAMNPKVLVLQEPSRGVDIGARLEIHKQLKEFASEGTAILVVTSDVEEAVNISDRLLVMRDGALVGELKGEKISQDEVLRLASGNFQKNGGVIK